MPTTAVDAVIHVAVGVVITDRRVLLSQRPRHLHQGGLWEFPGGKVEAAESVFAALCRELHEELGITVRAATPLVRIDHNYPDRAVVLDVWRVTDYAGQARGREGQQWRWVPVAELSSYEFPAANAQIVELLIGSLAAGCAVRPIE